MALFFDQSWFDGRLEELGKSHEDLAAEMGLPLKELAAVWKDQRELSAADVSAMARVLNVVEKQIAKRAGISTPVPGEDGAGEFVQMKLRISMLESRVKVLENQVIELQSVKAKL